MSYAHPSLPTLFRTERTVKQAQTQPVTTSQTAGLLPLLPLAKFGIAERLVQTEEYITYPKINLANILGLERTTRRLNPS